MAGTGEAEAPGVLDSVEGSTPELPAAPRGYGESPLMRQRLPFLFFLFLLGAGTFSSGSGNASSLLWGACAGSALRLQIGSRRTYRVTIQPGRGHWVKIHIH